MPELTGQGIWIWQLPQCRGGDVAAIVAQCKQRHFSHVLIKCADGAHSFACNARADEALVRELRANGITVAGWGYHYGRDPEAEARNAVQCCQRLGHTIYVCNAEKEFEDDNSAKGDDASTRARRFIKAFREHGAGIALGLCTFALPALHARFPWRAFLQDGNGCEFVMPQIYTVPSHARPYLAHLLSYAMRAEEELRAFGRPIIPVLRAYAGDGMNNWRQITEDARDFIHSEWTQKQKAYNWWMWQSAESNKEFWELVRNGIYVRPITITSHS